MGEQAMAFDLLRAGQVLFGPAFAAERDWPARLRSAYRRRAFETHPDRAGALGRAASELAREWELLNQAYRFLCEARTAAPPTWRAAPAARPARPRPEAGPARPGGAASAREPPPRKAPPSPAADGDAGAHARAPSAGGVRPPGRERPLPRRKLRFAEFLYYSGRVTFAELVEAVVWQRRQRPPLGDIAIEFGFLDRGQVVEILARRGREAACSVLFGEYAVRAGFLTPFQLLAALGRQRRLQKPIGEFFVERGLIDRAEIAEICHRIFFHNAACASA